MKRVLLERTATFRYSKKIKHEKNTTVDHEKRCNMKKMQYEKKCNMKRVQDKKV